MVGHIIFGSIILYVLKIMMFNCGNKSCTHIQWIKSKLSFLDKKSLYESIIESQS
jgi:hypothetical protein